MSVKRILGHVCTVGGILLVFLVLPAVLFVNFGAVLNVMGFDAVSGATQIITDRPSGQYVILLNREKFTASGNMEVWTDFFSDREVPVIMEDITCCVISGDENALELAQAFQSRLPENQMKITPMEGVMAVSRGEYGMFDVMVLSQEFADVYTASTLYDNEGVAVLTKAA